VRSSGFSRERTEELGGGPLGPQPLLHIAAALLRINLDRDVDGGLVGHDHWSEVTACRSDT